MIECLACTSSLHVLLPDMVSGLFDAPCHRISAMGDIYNIMSSYSKLVLSMVCDNSLFTPGMIRGI